MKFYPIKVACPQCHQPVTILETSFSLGGQIRYECICVVDGIRLESILTWENTILYCAQQQVKENAIEMAIVPEVKTIQ